MMDTKCPLYNDCKTILSSIAVINERITNLNEKLTAVITEVRNNYKKQELIQKDLNNWRVKMVAFSAFIGGALGFGGSKIFEIFWG